MKNIIEKIKNKIPKDKEIIKVTIFKLLFVIFFVLLLVLVLNSIININKKFNFSKVVSNDVLNNEYEEEVYDYETEDGWVQDENGIWHFYKEGVKLSNEFLLYEDKEYYLDENGDMKVSSWFEVENYWYYATEDGEIAKDMWVKDYYLGSDGRMLVNTETPDGYVVDENGKYIEGIKNVTYRIDNLYSVEEKIENNGISCVMDIILPMICDEDGVYNHNFNDKLELIKNAIIGMVYQKLVEYSGESKNVYSIICEACSISNQDYKNLEMEIAGVLYYNESEKKSLKIMVFYNKLTNEINCNVEFE